MLIDTHVWLWWAGDDPRLSAAIRAMLIESPPLVSAISAWEIATKVRSGKLILDRSANDWCEAWISSNLVIGAPISARIGELAGSYDWPHRDPADRLIVATAQVFDVPFLTYDDVLVSNIPTAIPLVDRGSGQISPNATTPPENG